MLSQAAPWLINLAQLGAIALIHISRISWFMVRVGGVASLPTKGFYGTWAPWKRQKNPRRSSISAKFSIMVKNLDCILENIHLSIKPMIRAIWQRTLSGFAPSVERGFAFSRSFWLYWNYARVYVRGGVFCPLSIYCDCHALPIEAAHLRFNLSINAATDFTQRGRTDWMPIASICNR